jgi:hypothetical protein
MLESFICLRLELLELLLNFYSLVVTIVFQISDSNFWQVFCCLHFSTNLHDFFSIFFPTKIVKLRIFETKKTCWLGEGEFNPTI